MPALQKDWLNRDRLTRQVIDGKDIRLVVLKAPAGYGKTTLARQLIALSRPEPAAWLHLDTFDQDPRRFTGYLTAALAQISPLVRQSRLLETIDDPSRSLTELHDDLLFLLEEQQTLAGWLVLDNWECVDALACHRDLVKRLLALANSRLRLIIPSRRPITIKTSRLRADGKALVLTEGDLCFTAGECERLLTQYAGDAITPELLAQVCEATQGWCMLTAMYARHVQSGARHLPRQSSTQDIGTQYQAYIEEELLENVDPRLAEFIMFCSVLDCIDIDSARALYGDDVDVAERFSMLLQSGLPYSLLGDGTVIRLHPLLRQAANLLLKTTVPREQVRRIYRHAYAWQEAHGLIVDAIESSVTIGDWPEALNMIDAHWYDFVAANGLPRLRGWLDTFPKSLQGDINFVDIYSRAIIQSGDNQELTAYLRPHLTALTATEATPRLVDLWVRYYWALINTGGDVSYHTIGKEFDALSTRSSSLDNKQLAGIEVVLCAAAYAELAIETGITHAKQALVLIENTSPEYAADIRDNLAILEHTRGNSHEAVRLFELGIEQCRSGGSFHGLPLRMFNLAWVYCATGHYQKAVEIINEGRAVITRYGLEDVYARMYADRYEGVARWYLGQRTHALTLLQNALKLAIAHNPGEQLETAIAHDYYTFLTGKKPSALDKCPLPPTGAQKETRLGYLAYQAARCIQARQFEPLQTYAEEMFQTSHTKQLLPWCAHAHFLLAFCENVRDNHDDCRKHLETGLNILGRIGWRSYPMANAPLSSFVFAQSVKYDILTDVAVTLVSGEYSPDCSDAFRIELEQPQLTAAERQRLLARAIDLRIRGLTECAKGERSSSDATLAKTADAYLAFIASAPPPGFTIRTIGTFEVTQRDRPIVFRRRTSRLLFQWLLTVRPRGIHREIISEYFWPEVPTTKGAVSLRTTIKDLRKVLDPHRDLPTDAYVCLKDEHYYLYLPEDSVVDVDLFDTYLNQARQVVAGRHRKTETEFEAMMRKALALVNGIFLPESIYESFTFEYRETLQRRFLAASEQLARRYIEKERYREAAAVLNTALKQDPLWADGIQLLMEAYVRMERPAEAMRVYREYERTLYRELQVTPDRILMEMFDSLTSKR
ncbi:MAG: hypothetical protein D6800_01815 [Candidatus Zixiibacteriota bacterium]|nr:MAG: hypothetical protein D6800_01815 [candidate division Zixibacteria bacterium]